MTDEPTQAPDPTPGDSKPHRPLPSETDKAKARKWFAHARKAAETRNYDYAIELYVNGLELWPEAIDEGLKPLRVAGTARKLAGGKPAGFLAARKRPTGGKEPAKSLNNALYLFGMDPVNITLMEQIQQLAAKADNIGTARWMAPILVEACNSGKKLSENRYAAITLAMETAAKRAIDFIEDAAALDILQANITISRIWEEHYPESSAAQKARSNASGNLTIVKGRFTRGDDFKESLKDAEYQHDLHDRDKTTHSVDRNRELIDRAKAEWEQNRGVPTKLIKVADLMIRSQDEALEQEAMQLLMKEFREAGDYVYKAKAEDILMRQMARQRREFVEKIKADPGDNALRKAFNQHALKQTATEVKIYRERMKQYPTDNRLRFMLATRLFAARQFDEAIPLFQQAQSDARCKTEARLYLGRCFYEKRFVDQAIGTLRKAIEEADTQTSKLAMDLNYWLGRSLEAGGHADDAREVYGSLIEIDYNFLDARQRLEKLVSGDAAG